ncbi:MAG: hypothetical protein ABF966_09775 [Bifidobacterium psychraerophilum]|uniref:hypothetical protein n=1 Tax=Bifidobacterium psychraerophilum TaxID=218140 RepID=UPI0039E77B63
MTTYIVSYDVKSGTAEDYQKVNDAIRKFDSPKRLLESLWMIHSNSSASKVLSQIEMSMHPDDRLLVAEINKNNQISNQYKS